MMSSQGPPSKPETDRASRRDEPFIHDVKPAGAGRRERRNSRLFSDRCIAQFTLQAGGARRDRTDDLMLAKHALYQLSYGPESGELRRAVVDP